MFFDNNKKNNILLYKITKIKMQEKINYLKERIDNITSIIGEEDMNPKSKDSRNQDNKFKNINDSISYIKMQMNDNTNATLDILKKSK